jgi:hypothetical protein
MMTAPESGITVLAHVERLLAQAHTAVATARGTAGVKLRPAQREALSRELAGAIANLEVVRLWLAAGAPR